LARSAKFGIGFILYRFLATFLLVILTFNNSAISLYSVLIDPIIPVALKLLIGFVVVIAHTYLLYRTKSLIGFIGMSVIFTFLLLFFLAAVPWFYPAVSFAEFVAFWLAMSLSSVYATGLCYALFDNFVSGVSHNEATH
jgi:hypothetical protein